MNPSLFSEDEPYQNGFQEETPVFEKKQVDLIFYLSDSCYVIKDFKLVEEMFKKIKLYCVKRFAAAQRRTDIRYFIGIGCCFL